MRRGVEQEHKEKGLERKILPCDRTKLLLADQH